MSAEDSWGEQPVDSTGITEGAGIPDDDLQRMFAAIDAAERLDAQE